MRAKNERCRDDVALVVICGRFLPDATSSLSRDRKTWTTGTFGDTMKYVYANL
jgi:hypothetical protein